MSFKTDYYKSDKIVIPQCKNCKYFVNAEGTIYCQKERNNKMNVDMFLNKEKCKNKEE